MNLGVAIVFRDAYARALEESLRALKRWGSARIAYFPATWGTPRLVRFHRDRRGRLWTK